MLISQVYGINTPQASIALALLFTTATSYLFRREDELFSEIVCWACLQFILGAITFMEQAPADLPIRHPTQQAPASPLSLWVVAACLSIVSGCRAEADGFKLLGQRHLGISRLAPLSNNLWLAALISALSTLTLTGWNYSGLVPSGIATGASFIAYLSFLKRAVKRRFLPSLTPFNCHVPFLAPRVAGLLLIGGLTRALIYGFPQTRPLYAFFLGLTKALSWGFASRAAHHTSWNLPTMMATFANTIAIHHAQRSAPMFTPEQPHPVEALFNRAKEEFQDRSSRQSSTFEAASNEYRNRYGIDPPPGFKEWYDAAISNDSPLIDEFDTIYQGLSPFWGLRGSQVRDTMIRTKNLPGSDLWLCTFAGIKSTTQCSHSHRTFDRHISRMFNNILANFTKIPDVMFLVNHIDEPRVLYQPSSKASYDHGWKTSVQDRGRKPIWDLLTENCDSTKKGTHAWDNVNGFGLPFVANTSFAQDLCQHPDYSATHGFMMSPVSFRPIHGLVPVFSTGKVSSMGDILIPSPAYNEEEFLYEESKDVDWERKRNNLYWAGSTTGGFALGTQWQLFHRQRFVELTQNLRKDKGYHYLRVKDGVVQKFKSSFLNGRLFDVAFTRIFQCHRKACRDQDAYFNAKTWVDKDEALKSKLAFDIDGNGISGRYYKLLASNSVPIKQTLLQEWHDDRLIPWLHYIPISQSMDELPELVFYLTSTPSGKEVAKRIAEQGREWYSRAFREVDMGLYVYRLLLEMARLQDPQREALFLSQ
ncbi:beta-1 2-xylosyltransferase 1 [Fusarium beomiforme]|uniref:Beta-1 2-xylosyltransferase 1 n=1 Tax=Fusarium beomiforme TaxID=44412 RepID=A0A9P5DSY8_9HYPO|nr:beta-1 2-xylosyltransferase 1 [Fusarium beomiforme]